MPGSGSSNPAAPCPRSTRSSTAAQCGRSMSSRRPSRMSHAKNLKESAELLVELGGNFSGDLPMDRVVDAAHQAGGVTVVAHPGRGDSVGLVTAEDLDKLPARDSRWTDSRRTTGRTRIPTPPSTAGSPTTAAC